MSKTRTVKVKNLKASPYTGKKPNASNDRRLLIAGLQHWWRPDFWRDDLRVVRYVLEPGIERPLAMISASGDITFFHQDVFGNVSALTNEAGAQAGGLDEGGGKSESGWYCSQGSS